MGLESAKCKQERKHVPPFSADVQGVQGRRRAHATPPIFSVSKPKWTIASILVGIWGYVIGTPIGVMMVEWLLRR